MRNKFEQLIEYIVNDEMEKADALLHNAVVEKSREIYNELVAEEMSDMDEADPMSMDATDDMMGDIAADEEGMDSDDDAVDMGDDMDDMDDMGDDMDDMGDEEGEGDLEGRVVDLEDELARLEQEFRELMDQDEEEMPEEGVMREYVEKVAAPANAEGHGVGAGSIGGTTNTKSTVAGKNDMGGTVKNLVQGGAESAPDGTGAYKKPSNEYTKGEGHTPHAGKFENVPGAKASKTFTSAKKPTSSEPAGINKKSTIDG